MSYQAPKGVFDIFPELESTEPSLHSSQIWEYVETICKTTAKEFNFHEIRTPIFEHTEVFTRSSGEASDIVSKEMYTFYDKGDRSLTLRPEGTAAVTRALMENQLLRKKGVQRLFYTGPFFRYDRPQAGRYRQFHQFGAEVYGIKHAELDAEMISMLMMIFKKLGLKNLTVQINSIGDLATRENYQTALKNYLIPLKDQLSKDSQIRLEKNPLRILDSKSNEDKLIIQNSPSILDFLTPESKLHLETVCETLKSLGINYQINSQLVRGLDYYNETVFEITTSHLGAQNTIGAGGRYDGLLEKLGGQPTPSFGFALGLERTILTMLEQKCSFGKKINKLFYFIPLNDEAKKIGITIINSLRKNGLNADIYYKNYKLQKALQSAFDESASFSIIMGDEELRTESVKVKNLEDKSEILVKVSDLISTCKNLLR